jgi:hypothetical protein
MPETSDGLAALLLLLLLLALASLVLLLPAVEAACDAVADSMTADVILITLAISLSKTW